MAVSEKRRVAITGLGVVSPLGCSVDANRARLFAGESGVGPIDRFDVEDLPARIAGVVRDFPWEDHLDRKERKNVDPFVQYALAAADMAAAEAGLRTWDYDDLRVGCLIGVGMGGLSSFEDNHRKLETTGPRRVSPFFVPRLIPNLAAGQVALRYGIRGPNHAPVSACASGAQAIGEAFRAIRDGYLDAAVAGGAEAAVTRLGMAGFAAMRALSTRNDAPEAASRPFDRGRDGFVMGEGAAVVVLEDWESAQRRGAEIRAEVLGFGATSDAHHITQPPEDGRGAAACIRAALEDAGLAPDEVGYVNAHGTSTPAGDVAEAVALRTVLGAAADEVPVSSTKSMTGHLLGAAGAVETVFTVLALEDQRVPPTINLDDPDPDCALRHVPGESLSHRFDVAVSNAFGFGGTNVVLVLGRADEGAS